MKGPSVAAPPNSSSLSAPFWDAPTVKDVKSILALAAILLLIIAPTLLLAEHLQNTHPLATLIILSFNLILSLAWFVATARIAFRKVERELSKTDAD